MTIPRPAAPLRNKVTLQISVHMFPTFSTAQADLIKLSDADMEWLLGISLTTALLNPCAVRMGVGELDVDTCIRV